MKSNRFLSWISAEFFFVCGVLMSTAFAVLSNEIAARLKLSESDIGLLSGIYFITYAAGQLGLGILISRVPARFLLGLTALVAAAGTIIFSVSDGLVVALIGRTLMGIGVSTTFVGVIYLVGLGYQKNFAFMSSLSLSLANLSAAGLSASSAFLPLLVDFRLPFQVGTALFVLSGVLVLAFVRSPSPSASSTVEPPLGEAFKVVISSDQFWAALVFYSGLFGTLVAFSYLWNIQFQINLFHHTVQQSAVMNAMIPLGVTLGGLVAGAWAARTGFVLPARVFALLTFACFTALLLFPLSMGAAGVVMFVIGCGFSSSTLGIVVLQEHLPSHATPLATSLVATVALIFGGIVQPLVGAAIGSPHPVGAFFTLIQTSNPEFGDSQRGLLWLLASVLLAVVASFFFRAAPLTTLGLKRNRPAS